MTLLRKILATTLFLSPLFAIAQSDDSIQWSADKRLSWNDYLAQPSSSSDAAALTSTSIGVEYHLRNNSFSYHIACVFSKTRSWGRYKTDYILQHEQGHFDITEIFARKLAKELKEYKFNASKFQDDVSKIYKRVMDEKEAYQNKYDSETDFSRNKEKQAEWLEKISQQLKATEEFFNYQSTVHIEKIIS